MKSAKRHLADHSAPSATGSPVSGLVKALLDNGDVCVLHSAFRQAHPDLGEEAVKQVCLQFCLMHRADHALTRVVRELHPEYDAQLKIEIISAAQRLLRQGSLDDVNQLVRFLQTHLKRDYKVEELHLRCLLAADDMAALGQRLSSFSQRDYRLFPELLEFKIEFDCARKDFDAAQETLDSLEPLNSLPANFLLLALKVSSAKGDDRTAAEIACHWINRDFSYARHAALVFRVIKAAGRQGELLEKVEQIHGWFRSPDLCRLHAVLKESVHTAELPYAASADQPVQAHGTAPNVTRIGRPLATVIPSSSRKAVFFCTDAPYGAATLVALTSAVVNAVYVDPECDFYVFVPPEEEATWQEAARRLSTEFRNLGMHVVASLNDQLPDSRCQYGFNTSGRVLSNTAYARLYAALYLQDRGVSRALYLDSDIVVQQSLESLLSFDLQGFPLGARTERPHIQVSKAIRLHEIPNGKYFNSGVMLLDLEHPAAASALSRSIGYSEDTGVTLLFHDQCALNKALTGLYRPIPERFNHFFLFDQQMSETDCAATILHFISSPKPWSPLYRGEGSALWARHWDRAEKIVGHEVAAVIRARSEGRPGRAERALHTAPRSEFAVALPAA